MSDVEPIQFPPIDFGAGNIEALRKILQDPEFQAKMKDDLSVAVANAVNEAPARIFRLVIIDDLFAPAPLFVYSVWMLVGAFIWLTRKLPLVHSLFAVAVFILYLFAETVNAFLAGHFIPATGARQYFDETSVFFSVYILLPMSLLATASVVNVLVRTVICRDRCKERGDAPAQHEKKDKRPTQQQQQQQQGAQGQKKQGQEGLRKRN